MIRRRLSNRARGGAAAGVALLVALLVAGTLRDADFWSSPDRRGDALLREDRYEEAAAKYADAWRRGVALYRAGRYEDAAVALASAPGEIGAYDRGNALVMLGQYDEAVESYERALSLRPGWRPAEDNMQIAIARRDRLITEGGEGTGGKLSADDVVFDLNSNENSGGGSEETEGDAPLSDPELSALWLRKVQTTPGDFLRAKFSYQVQRRRQER